MVYALIGSILFSFKAIFTKLAYDTGLAASNLVFLRFGMSIPILWSILIFRNRAKGKSLALPHEANLPNIFIVGILFSAAAISDFEALGYLPVSVERMVLFTYPAIILLIESLRRGCLPASHDIFAFCIVYLGLFFIVGSGDATPGQSAQGYSTTGIYLALVAAVTYAAYLVTSRRSVQEIGSLALTTYINFIAFGVILAVYNTDIITEMDITGLGFIYALAITIFSTVVPYLLIFEAIKRIGSGTTGLVSMVSPVASLLSAMLILGEEISQPQAIGCALVISGVGLLKVVSIQKMRHLRNSTSIR